MKSVETVSGIPYSGNVQIRVSLSADIQNCGDMQNVRLVRTNMKCSGSIRV